MRNRTGRVLALGLVIALLPAATAHATDRYADAVAGDNDNDLGVDGCTAPPPADGCAITHAITGAQTLTGDRVIVASGTYNLGASILQVQKANLEIAGPGPAQATINVSTNFAPAILIQAPGVAVSGLRITQTGTSAGFQFDTNAAGSAGARLSVSSGGGAGSSACRFTANGTTTLTDSVCRFTNPGGFGAIQVDGAAPVVNLRNVTAHSTAGTSVGLFARSAAGQSASINARNSIFSSPTGSDVAAESLTAGATVMIDLDYSAYAETSEVGNPADTEITEEGTLNNITGIPAFTDTDLTFHQALGSPTIDKGSAAFATTPFDIDGGARIVDGLPDIGADEFVFVPPVPVTPAQPIATPAAGPTGQQAAALKKCKKKKGRARSKCKKKAKKLPL